MLATIGHLHKSSSNDIPFIEDPNAITKQIAYALFRKTRFGSSKDLLKLKTKDTKVIAVKYSETETITATYYKTNFGFEYKLINPDTNTTYIINEEGVLKKL